MPSIIPSRINKCWQYVDQSTNEPVEACSIDFQNQQTKVISNGIIRSHLDNIGKSIFSDVFVKACDPKKDKKCIINIDNKFVKECNPKKDKKCTINMEQLLFGNQ